MQRLLPLLALIAGLAPLAHAGELTFRFDEAFGEKGPGHSELREPVDVAITGGGDVVVLDRDRGALVFFSSSGRWLRTVGETSGQGGLELREPQALAVDSKGRLWVVDSGNHRLVILDANGKLQQVVGSLGTQSGRFRHPSDIAFDGFGKAYVADAGNERIQVLGPDGAFVASWDRRTGGRRDHLSNPQSLAYTDQGQGSIWVANHGSSQLERFNLDGEWEQDLDLKGIAEGELAIRRLKVEPTFYRMFVADSAGGRVLVVSKRGELVTEIRPPAKSAPMKPQGLVVTRLLDVFVADSGKPRVLKFERD